jgi:lipoprotein-anchoring transpeptidase ErfK/SrfK
MIRKKPKWRAMLLAGVAAALFAEVASSHANTVNRGATRQPVVIVTDPGWKPKELPPVTTRHIYHNYNDVPLRYRQWHAPIETGPPKIRPDRTEPAKAKPAYIRPEKAAPAEIRPVKVRPVEVEPKPATPAKSDATKSGIAKNDATKSDITKTDAAKKAAKRNETADRRPDKSAAATAGTLHVIVSLNEQRASLYANGRFVASTKVSTGTKSHPTPLGVFSVIQKNRHHVSNLYGAPMPYMQRLTWSGTALHAGPLPGYPASHGCIRLTNDFAQLLWKATRIGARVIVTRNDVQPVEISHARLVPPQAPAAMASAADGAADVAGGMVRTADAASALGVAPIAVGITPTGPVSIFISRKDARLYVRQAMQPLFDMPVSLRDPGEPIGTHVYTAMGIKDGAMRWTAVSIPSGHQREVVKTGKTVKNGKKSHAETVVRLVDAPTQGAGAALDRFDFPQEALDRLAGMIVPGSSLIVSDNGLSHETGKGTDFIVLTQ